MSLMFLSSVGESFAVACVARGRGLSALVMSLVPLGDVVGVWVMEVVDAGPENEEGRRGGTRRRASLAGSAAGRNSGASRLGVRRGGG